jgi:hypothetical protein
MRRLLCIVLALGAVPSFGARLGGAFLDSGLGGRALGLGGAQTAVAVGPAAVFYNPAGLAAEQGRGLLATYQPMSLERTSAGLAAALNLRGDLAFGLAWLHAGVDGLQARSGAGEVIAGSLTDSENAVFFGLGLRIDERLQIGGGVRILDQRIEVPQVGASTASGRSLDLGLRYRWRPRTTFAVALRNLGDKLSWTVRRPASQSSTSEEALRSAAVVGVFHQLHDNALAALDVEILDLGADREVRAHAGAELRLSELLTLRGGLHRMAEADGAGLLTFGVSVRPMRIEALEVHYAYVADDVDSGSRTVLSVSGRFP